MLSIINLILKNMQLKREIFPIFKNGNFTFYIAISEKIVFFLFFLGLARTISTEEYGFISFIFAFNTLLSAFFEFGFANYLQREAAYNDELFSEKLSQIILVKIASVGLYLLIIYLYFNTSNNLLLASLISLTNNILIINNIFVRTFFGFLKYNLAFYTQIISRIVFILLLMIAYLFHFQLIIYIVFFVIMAIIQLVHLLYYCPKMNIVIKLTLPDIKLLKKIFTLSLPIGLGILFVWMYDKLDIILIKHFLGLEKVAVYSVAYSFYKLPQVFAGVILIPLFSTYSHSFRNEGLLKFTDIKSSVFVLTILSISTIIFYYFGSDTIFDIFYGVNYCESASVLKLLVIALPALYLNNLTGVLLNSIKMEKFPMYSGFASLIINLVFNIILLSKIGIIAAVISTIITEYSNFIIQFFVLFRSGKVIK